MQGSQSREAEDGAGIRRPKEARRGDDEDAAGGWITGETERAEDEAGERERETRGDLCVCVFARVCLCVYVRLIFNNC